ncbi:SMC family ATPase [Actinomycetospora sp. NBC_00405]|uniref:SMC family ATPase n=1 Tax=Actinomycetospora sp. NBC_00405 TaxID=2975952 RepID=UPI002E222142
MRPVLLRMDGFAAFRHETTVDFSDAEYFALVGPTGAGKSTVIDAMVFALYGSVPRWDDRRAVRLALAPTTMRGTVSLVFDVGGERYVVARELRRAASGGVTVRTARLERLLDPAGLAAAEEETAPLADGAPKVTDAVTELLGLPFEDFCTCVVLPQGDFAEFLHAAAGKRQEKLERILGLGVYDLIMRRANTEAATATQRAGLLADQLQGVADATREAEEAAQARVGALAALAEQVEAAVPQLATAETTVAQAEADRARLAGEQAALSGLTPPAGLAELADRHRDAARTVAAATEHAAVAEDDESAARARLDAGPDRAALEQTRRAHTELVELREQLPPARERREDAGDAYRRAATAAVTATGELEVARAARDTALEADKAAGAEVQRLVGERDALRAPTVPDGLDDLHARTGAATEALERAAEHLAAVDTAEARARAALAGAPVRGLLEQARRDHRDLATTREEHRSAGDRHAAAEKKAAEAAALVGDTRARLDAAREEHDRLLRSDLAAALRPTLIPGAPCPVCAQDVAHPPEALPAADLDGANYALAAAEQADEQARAARADADAAVARAADDLARWGTRIEALTAALADAPATAAAVDAALAERDRVEAAADDAATAARTARRERDTAAEAREELRRESAAAAGALRTARDPLVSLGAPAPDEASPLAGWRALVDWARGRADERVTALTAARAGADVAGRAREEADRRHAASQNAATDARRAETAAARADQEAEGVVADLERRTEALGATLDGAPTLEEATTALARIAELEGTARAAAAAARAARTAVADARWDASAIDQEVARAWEVWHRARDPLVALGAPPAPGDDLGAAWTALTAWAAGETATREQALTGAGELVERRRDERDAVERRLTDALVAHELTARPSSAPIVVATALERARGELARITERRARAADLDRQRAEAEEEGQVARMLGEQLRSNRFPRWLVASALDTLVADASASLADLSGGQFELTHADGEFLVVDHADADAPRPVKTLSGGETFQASLALALALSSQLQGLAARGAARLESIFLDEGFGTLDETNLDLVASALENLAARGDRMVGVVTHVPALAERVPVRFVVGRDQRTSSVLREGA